MVNEETTVAKNPFDEHVTVARRYFYAGFLGLPMLWMFMAISMYPRSRKADAPKVLRF